MSYSPLTHNSPSSTNQERYFSRVNFSKEIIDIPKQYLILESLLKPQELLRGREGRVSSVFSDSPDSYIRIFRINDLASFAVLGLDVKITPGGEVKMIEVNGIRSGMSGFAQAGIQFEGFPSLGELRSRFPFDLENDELWAYIKTSLEEGNSCDEALRAHIHGLGKEPIEYIAWQLERNGITPSRLEGTGQLRGYDAQKRNNGFMSIDSLISSQADTTDIHPDWDIEYGHFAETLKRIERILRDKNETDELFEECRSVKPRTYRYSERGLTALIREERPKFLVIKPYDGSRGEGVTIIPADAAQEERPDFNGAMVIEGFVPSKPIFSPQDDQFHDGCMRYVVFVEESKKGGIEMFHFGGYWRLCPNPLTDSLDMDAMRANLAQGAIPQKASAADLRCVQDAVDKNIPQVYRRLVERAEFRDFFRRMKAVS